MKDFNYFDLVGRNWGSITKEDQLKIKNFKVGIIGCGGQGGHIVSTLAYCGVGFFRCSDGDVFEVSNLNRQILSNSKTLGRNKAERACEYVKDVNPFIETEVIPEHINTKNIDRMIEGLDLVINNSDNFETKALSSRKCKEKGIPFIFAHMFNPAFIHISYQDPNGISVEEALNMPTLQHKELTDELLKKLFAVNYRERLERKIEIGCVKEWKESNINADKIVWNSFAPFIGITSNYIAHEAICCILKRDMYIPVSCPDFLHINVMKREIKIINTNKEQLNWKSI